MKTIPMLKDYNNANYQNVHVTESIHRPHQNARDILKELEKELEKQCWISYGNKKGLNKQSNLEQ